MHRSKNLLLYLTIVTCFTILNCGNDYPNDRPQPPPSTNDFYINFFNPPDNYNVKDDKLFTINIEPVLNGITGIFRIWFEIEYNYNVVGISNYIYFNESNGGIKTLEWGGGSDFGFGSNSNSGNCRIVAHLEKYENFPDPNASPTSQITQDGSNNIEIYKFLDNDIAHELWVEFDQQQNQNLWNHFFDELIKQAFNPTLRRFRIEEQTYTNQHDLTEEYIEFRTQVIWDYIGSNKDFTNWYYLCGIKGFMDDQGNILPNIAGASIRLDQSSDHFGSLIAYEVPIQYKPKPYQNIDTWEFIDNMLTLIIIHEFGHQLGLPSDAHTNHSSGNIFCIMYQGVYPRFNPNLNYGRSLYENPHFCLKHVNDILSLQP